MNIKRKTKKCKANKKSFIDKWVHKHTEKPEYYKEVKNPPETFFQKLRRPQDARQIQYNNWSKQFKVYSGSYLPKDDEVLLNKGWEEETHPQNTTGDRSFRRKSTNQHVKHDYNIKYPKDRKKCGRHWHWLNFWKKTLKGYKSNADDAYYDKYGNTCKKGGKNSSHHIGEEGEDYKPC